MRESYLYRRVLEVLSESLFGGSSLEELNAEQWIALMDEVSVYDLPFLAEIAGGSFVPHTISLLDAGRKKSYGGFLSARLEILEKFSAVARREKLRFVLLKGMALSRSIYGDAGMRKSSDIDILVDTDDLCKADYVARSVGFVQPQMFFEARRMVDEGALDKSSLEKMASRFVVRHRQGYDHIGPHFAYHDNCLIPLEIHDKIAGIEGSQMMPFLWDTRIARMGSTEVNVLSPVAEAASLILFAHDDSESFAANASSSCLGLKLYLDLAVVVSRNPSLAESAVSLLNRIEGGSRAAVVFGNLCDLFPEMRELVLATESSSWGPYVDRLVNAPERMSYALAIEKRRIAENGDFFVGCSGVVASWRISDSVVSSVCMEMQGNTFSAQWILPACLLSDIECFVFQTRLLLMGSESPFAEIRLDLFIDGGRFACFARPAKVFSRSGKASRKARGYRCDVATVALGGGGASVSAKLDLSAILHSPELLEGVNPIGFDASIYQNHVVDLFYRKFEDVKFVNGNDF